MSTLAIARKDFNDAVRSKVLLTITGAFIAVCGGATFLYGRFIVDELAGAELDTLGLIQMMYAGLESFNPLIPGIGLSPVHVFLPFVGILLGYRAIVKERETGQIKLLLSLPHSRADVVFGKLLGRVSVGVVAAVSGFALAIVIGAIMYQDFLPTEFAGFILATVIFLLVYVSIGIGISSAAPSSRIAIAAAAIYLVVFHALWGAFFWLLRIVAFGGLEGPYEGAPDWLFFLRELNPARAYNHLVVLFVAGEAQTLENAPVYLQDWFFLFVMLFWFVVPLGIGYALLDDADL